ncbi:CinA family protein [uncultured Hyphomicrobium sp.]|uniref:CinA family protein n=1 Tax=uncultured Hyphomicrobium sp. TaxID=194373 RepID=UPI0034548903
MAAAQRTTVVTAESCTAGSLATLIADTPGAGEMFAGGFVTYAKACKEAVLGIPSSLIENETAVSAEVAREMARGALRSCVVADVAVAITCVGGPKPDEDGNPVGLTHIAVCDRDGAFARTSETYTARLPRSDLRC